MLKFNRKTEYALIALRYIANHSDKSDRDQVVSARAISANYKIPYPVMSKVLQELHHHGLIQSIQGTKGGYSINKPLADITLAQLVEIFEGPIGVTDCAGSSVACFLNDACNVKTLFRNINERIREMLHAINLEELDGSSEPDTYQPAITETSKSATNSVLN